VGVDDYLLKLERNLMLGAGRWVAEFNEAFRDFPVGDHTFDLYVRGGTRPKGFLLSRLFAYFSLPSYNVALFAKHVPEDVLEDEFCLKDLTKALMNRATEKNIKWTWLVLIRTESFSDQLVKTVDGFEEPELGISLVNLAERDVDTSPNALGRKALSLVRIFK
jgi:hypothetical protein